MGIYKVKNNFSSIMVYAYMKQSVCIHTHTLICICIYFIHFSLFLLFLFIESLEVNQINWILLTFFILTFKKFIHQVREVGHEREIEILKQLLMGWKGRGAKLKTSNKRHSMIWFSQWNLFSLVYLVWGFKLWWWFCDH